MSCKRSATLILLTAFVFGLACQADAAVKLNSLFTDHMVLQQKARIPVWGTADPGEKVTVTLCGRSASDKADKNGEWMVKLGSLTAGGPHQMTVTGKDNTITLKDVLVGEVWVASGQSNMQMTVKSSNNAEKEIAAANYEGIRLFYVPRKVADTPQKTVDAAWQKCTSETVPGFSAVAYFFGRDLHKELNVPIGLIHSSWGGTPAESWTRYGYLETLKDCDPLLERWKKVVADTPKIKADFDKKMAAWNEAVKKAKAEGKKAPNRPRDPHSATHPHRPASLYNGMIAPLIPYAIQGAIWYQGESNAGRAYQYRSLFPGMIKNWRKDWGQGKFPFLFVQLANFRETQPEPCDDAWAELREAQTMTLDLKNTGMAVTIDIGEAKDIHPRNKQDVGKRLALWALDDTYRKDVTYSGPLYRNKRIRDGKIVVTFKCADGGLVAKDGELKGFAIAGADKKFVWAKAEIVGKNKVAVWADEVPLPRAVRYAWAINPVCNLYNGEGLPASPFRTDEWPGMTINNK